MNKLVLTLRVALLVMLPAVAARGQAPPNDIFFNAIPINGPIATVTGSNVGASKNFGGEPFLVGGSFGGASVWWTWTATASGQTTIDTEGSDFNTLLGVFTGTVPNQLTLIADNDNFEGNQWSRVMFNAVAGTTYRIVVDGFRTGGGPGGRAAQGNIVLHVKGVGGLELSVTNGMVFTVGDPIPVNVTITPDFPNPPATRVDFFRRSSPNLAPVQFASLTSAPFNAVATNLPAGSNTFYVVVFDMMGNPVQSPTVNVLVQNVGVTLLTPFEDTLLGPTNPLVATAWAYLPGGTITNVEFLLDGVKFAEDDTPPYSGTLSNVASGSHRLTAVGRSDTGARFTSQSVNLGVVSAFVAWGSVWRYLDDGSDQGTNWIAPHFEDDDWKYGPAELGYGDGDEATVVEDDPTPGYTPNANDRFITTYFRQTFDVSSTNGLAGLVMILERDDGGVVYLNGRELFRTPNMPQAPTNITYTTTTTDGIGIEDTIDAVFLSPTNLIIGANVFAVEIHQQAANSSDISFNLQLLGIPTIIHNLSPLVELTNPPPNSFFLAPTSINLGATAQDYDGSVAKVEFFVDGVKIDEDSTEPYTGVWNNPSFAAHVLTAVATDDQGATTTSTEIPVVVYDDNGTPVAAITSPMDGFVTQGPTNWLVTATANAITGVTNVEFFNNGVSFGSDSTAPYSALWVAPFGTNFLTAVATDAGGVKGTSPVVVATITIPPTNVIAPTIFNQNPPAGATVSNTLTSITVAFSENVQNVDASDLLVNGVPATGVSANHSTFVYTFTFAQPPYGTVNISWAADDGITDYGWPTLLDFDGTGPGATWSYSLIDRLAPVVSARTPAAGATVTNLTQISVTFSEPVTGVDGPDLLLNGVPALNVSGGGASYTFNVVQPSAGTNTVTWSTNNGIFDLAATPNAFNRSNTANNWSFILDTRVALVQSNSMWLFIKGTNEASEPRSAWRQPEYEDSGWSNAPAPLFYGEPSLTNANIHGTVLSDMQSNYTSIYLRKEFTVLKRGDITNVLLNAQVDDGFIAWINGTEVARVLMPTGEVAFNAVATAQANEPQNSGAAYIVYSLTNALRALVDGRNVLAVHAFNQNLTNSSDFSFNAQLYYFPLDATTVPPRLLDPTPPQGDVLSLSNVTITFSEAVAGVGATDLLVNGTPATDVTTTTNTTYTFGFPQPPYGNVVLTWATNHGITDFDNPPKAFNGTNANATLRYFLINPSNPKIASQIPAASTTITGLTAVAVTFTEPVSGVDAADLLVAGTPASAVLSPDAVTYTFTFPQPPFGAVTIRWATNHGITDIEAGNAFDPTRFGGQWNYTLIDPVPSVTLSSPTNNSFFLPPASVTLRATASDNDGTVALVEFYERANKLGEGTTAPYTLGVSNLLVGTYVFRAVATDNQGLSRTSAPSVLNVVTSLPISLVRGPYLQIGSSTGAVVRWRTQVPSDAVVRYGPDPYNLTNLAFVTTLTNEQIVTLTGLEPDTKYCYSIGNAAQNLVGGENNGDDYWFKTSPVPGTRRPIRLWVLGDAGTAGNGDPARQQSTRDAFYNFAETNGKPADIWLLLGDNAYNSGQDSEHQAAIFDMYPTTLRNKFVWPTIGNHETDQSFTAVNFPYLDIFSLPTEGQAGGVASGTEKYYSFDYANIHFICLDSMSSGRSATNAMGMWLQADLAATTAEWLIVFFHHPPYTKGNHDSDRENELIEIRQNILPILETNGVDLVLCGHSHAWERSYLLHGHYGLSSTMTNSMKIDGGDGREEGDGAYHKNAAGEGVVYTVAGNAGQVTGGPLNHPAHFLELNELGTMVIDVNSNRLDAMLLRDTGEIRDTFTLTKPPPTPSAPINLLAVPTGPNEITLFWTPGSTNQLGFSLERSTDGVNFTQIFALPPEANNALDTPLLANTTYFYRVRGTNAFGPSDWSALASASTVMPASAPRAPAGLVASAGDGLHFFRSRMVLTWQDRSTNEAAFQIERSADGAAFIPVATVAANLDAFVDEGLDSATLYFYRVRSLNALGLSTPSNLAGDQTHPQNQFARAGQTVSFHAGSEGAAPVAYQWRFNGAAIPGATSETLVLSNVQLSDEGEYAALIRDASGVLITKPAYLIVVAPPRIVVQPQDQLGIAESTLILASVAEGTEPMTYHWRKNGAFLPGANSPSLLLPNIQEIDNGGYDVVVENDFGSATSRVATVTVYSLPSLEPMPDIPAEVLKPLVVPLIVNDANQPPLLLNLSLAPGAPTNSRVHAVSQSFHWTPNRAQSPGTHPVTVRVVDQTRPFLSNQMTFNVVVKDYVEATVGSTALLVGTNGSVPIDFFSSAPLSELQAVVQLPGERLQNLSVEALAPALATVTLQSPDANTAAITIAASACNTLQVTQTLAWLNFTAVAGQASSFTPLHLESVTPIHVEPGLPPTVLANHGRVVLIGTQPLLDARMNNGGREVVVYGKAGVTYQLQYATNLLNPIWTLRSQVAFTNLSRSFFPGNTPPTNRPGYFRARPL